jgi:hypothetical protein
MNDRKSMQKTDYLRISVLKKGGVAVKKSWANVCAALTVSEIAISARIL